MDNIFMHDASPTWSAFILGADSCLFGFKTDIWLKWFRKRSRDRKIFRWNGKKWGCWYLLWRWDWKTVFVYSSSEKSERYKSYDFLINVFIELPFANAQL